MGSIDRFRRNGDHHPPAGPTVGAAATQRHPGPPPGPDPGDVRFVGQPVAYQPSQFSFEESWQLLSPSMQEWVQHRAGPAIRDPHTGIPTVYAFCRVAPEPVPLKGATGATYELVVFGKRGLVVSDGTTPHLVPEPGATRWQHRRFDVPVDPTAVRNDHRPSEPANPAGDGAGWVGPAGGMLGLGAGSGLLPPAVAEVLGNLPVASQRFLLEPFVRSGRPPVQARVHPAIIERGAELREVYWACFFNAGWLSFACAERAVSRWGGHGGTDLWHDPAEVEALRRAPWTIAAWVAPVDAAAGSALAGGAAGGSAGTFGDFPGALRT